MQDVDLLVLGGGNAYRVAHEAAEAGQRVVLVERSLLGGTCPNRGCIPSKLLLRHAHAARAVRRAGEFHARATLHDVDGAAVLRDAMAWTAGGDERFEQRLPDSATLLRGTARFVGERTVEVDGERVRGARVVIATGSRPRLADADLAPRDAYWTSDDVFTLDELPSSIVIVGGGYVGVEFATFFADIGARTTLVHRGDALLEQEDAEIREHVRAALAERLDLRLGSSVTAVERAGAGRRVELDGPDGAARVDAEALLFAIGRVPNTDELSPERAGVELDARGHVRADDHLRTSAERVYALGDVIGRHPFTHTASHEAHYLVQQLVRGADEAPIHYGPVPHAVFSDPPVAAVGPTEAQLRERGEPFVVGRAEWEDTAMGHGLREQHGLAKLLVAPDGRMLGAHLVGEQAPTLLHQLLPMLHWKNDVRALAGMIHVHPALNEVLQAAARDAASELDDDG